MAELFLGDLSQIKLFDILKPLLMGKKTGKLSFKGIDHGEIYLEFGDIVHARTPDSSGELSFFKIMEWSLGKVTFESEEVSPERTIPIPSEQLLLNWSSKKIEWEKIKELISSNKDVFRLSLQKNGENKTISADQWNVLALSNGMRTISDIGKTLEWDELKTVRITYHLLQAGLLERVGAQKLLRKKVAGVNFFQTVENELKKVVGPVAPFIIEDKLIEFGETKESFPKDQALSFIESLGEEIPHELKKKEFIKVMMEGLPLGK